MDDTVKQFRKGDRGGPGSMSAAEGDDIAAYCQDYAVRWAEKFSETYPGCGVDEKTMISWFSTAIETACDKRKDDDARQCELAVIEAAKIWHNCNDHESWQKAGEALMDAVDALIASQPVDPQTLKPGTRFRFEDATKYQEFIAIKSEGRMVGLSDWRTFEFVTGARVIPLPDDTE